MQGKELYEEAFLKAISQLVEDYTETVKCLDEARNKGKEKYKEEMDWFKLSQLNDIVKQILIPKDKGLRNILLTLRKAMESQEKFRELDLKMQWGLASKFEQGKAGFYIVESTEYYKQFTDLLAKRFG